MHRKWNLIIDSQLDYEGTFKYEWPVEGKRYKGQFHLENMEGNGVSHYSDGSGT